MHIPPLSRLALAAACICVAAPLSANQADVIARAKRATVLVEIPREDESGSAFSIGDGYLVTSAHLVESAPGGRGIRVVLDPGERGQRVLPARVVRADKERDLALLRIEPASAPAPLKLGGMASLVETAPVTVLGFPFGSFLAERPDEFPNVTVTTGRITALRKSRGELQHIQLDASVNPGNSGGPVINQQGEVVGVVRAILPGTDLNFAVPVNRLREFLSRPEITVTPPEPSKAGAGALTFTIDVVSFMAGEGEMTVAFTVSEDGGALKTYAAAPQGSGRYSVSVKGASPAAGGSVQLTVSDGQKTTNFSAKDVTLRAGTQQIRLSEIESITRGPMPRITLRGGRAVTGPVPGLGAVAAEVNGVPVTLDLLKYSSVQVSAGGTAPPAMDYTVSVKQGGRTLGEVSGSLRTGVAAGGDAGGAQGPSPVGSSYTRNPANGHWYCVVRLDTTISWPDARKAAESMRYMGKKGHLVTITSADEMDFVAATFPGDARSSWWIGGYQDKSAPDFRETAGGWRWVTGEPWSFTAWRRGEPNDLDGNANFLNMFPDGPWNDTVATDDHGRGYVVEFE